MKRKLFASVIVALAMMGCDTDDLSYDMSQNVWGDGTGTSGSDSEESTDKTQDDGTTGDTPMASNGAEEVMNFDVTWDMIADGEYADGEESVTGIVDNDLVENSTFDSIIYVEYGESGAVVTGSVEGVSVSVDGGKVKVEAETGGVEYVLSGTSSNGQFKVYGSKKIKVTLNGLNLMNQTGSALNFQTKKRIFLESASGTENVLEDAEEYSSTPEEEDEKGCVFGEGQMIFTGTGKLTVNGNKKHGICSDDYVVIRKGSDITINSKKDGIHANDNFVMTGGIVKIKSEDGDGIESENTSVVISGGLLKVETDGEATKGIKAAGNITISGGQQVVITNGGAEYEDDEVSSSSCLKCDTSVYITGGETYLKSRGEGGKGIKAGGVMNMTDGKLRIVTEGGKYTYGSSSNNGNGFGGGWGGPGGGWGQSGSSSNSASPKGIRVTGNLFISGGEVRVRCLGASEGSEGIESKSKMYLKGGDIAVYTADDAFNAASHLEISGGSIYAFATNNDGMDSNGTITITGGVVVSLGTTSPEEGLDCDQNTFTITGGTVLGIGGATSTPTSSKCTQRVVIYGGAGQKGTMITIAKDNGEQLMSYTMPRQYGTMTMLFSSEKIAEGGTYNIYTDGTYSGGTEYNGLVTGGAYEAGNKLTSFTASNMVTSVGSVDSGPGGGFGGGFGGH